MATRTDALELLWGRPPAGRRGPKPTLTHEQITVVGVELADAEGLPAVTMQRIAAALQVTKMALYRYVPGKAELVALMTDAAIGAPPDLPDGPWRTALMEWAHHAYARFERHPWTLTTIAGERPIGPNEVGWLEVACARLADTGLAGAEILDVTATLMGHVRSVAQQGTADGSATPERTFARNIARLLRGHEDRYPAVAAAIATAAADGRTDQALDFGLERLLDGIELLIDRSAVERRGT